MSFTWVLLMAGKRYRVRRLFRLPIHRSSGETVFEYRIGRWTDLSVVITNLIKASAHFQYLNNLITVFVALFVSRYHIDL